ncbi:hypothetical protein ACQP1G_16930 [Nocardia sp. CA-107356]|uniref:hypothetical protein n=1 Tax=Nocardia sp. CA-107356 TaxID=3239972 RepID=UPI003D9461E7
MATTVIGPVHFQCARYRRENSFDTTVDIHDHIILKAGAVDGIRMPQKLGDLVRAELHRRQLPTPIIVNTATEYRMFLTQGAGPDNRPIALFAKLFRCQAIGTVPGALVMLPCPADQVRFWLDQPEGMRRPPFDTVVEITLHAAKAFPGATA